MFLKAINSGSDGNCYLLENDKEALVIECGCRMQDVKINLGFNISKVVGCIVTHEHLDHAKYIPDMMKCGIDVYASDGTRSEIETKTGELVNKITRGLEIQLNSGESIPSYHPFQLGGFTIHPFATKHNSVEPIGFLIKHADIGKLLFATDTELIYHDFTKVGITTIMCEANYSKKYLSNSECKYNHVLTGHMSIETCCSFLKMNNTNYLENVVLIHLSNSSSNEFEFLESARSVVGNNVNVLCANKGTEISIDKWFG